MLGKLNSYVKRIGIFLIMGALLAGMAGCPGGYNPPPSQNLEIRTWYDLDLVRHNLAGNHTLMKDLDSTTPGYDELASPTAIGGKGWQPIGFGYWAGTQAGIQVFGEIFKGTFDGQGYEIRDLYINGPDGCQAGLFGFVGEEGIIKNITLMNATVNGCEAVGGLVGFNEDNVSCLIGSLWAAGGLVGYSGGTVSNSYCGGNVTGEGGVGGLAGVNDGVVTNSYSSCSVSGMVYVGGLVGHNGGTVSNSYSAGNVTGGNFTGGLVGTNAGNVSNSFWDIETSGQPTSAGGTGKNTTEMQDIVTFSGAGWNITAVANSSTRDPTYIWNIVNNVTYPFLSWESI